MQGNYLSPYFVMFNMAHSFLKKMLDAESNRFQLEIFSCLAGGVFLLNSFLIQCIYPDPDFPEMLALAAALLLGTPLVWHALQDLWRGAAEMNELAALSFLAALSTGEYRTAAAIAFFMIISKLIEYRSQVGARRNIESLLRLAPGKAFRLENGLEIETDSAALKKGDLIRVRPGDSIPGDGFVMTGTSSVNEATITGESLPVDKKHGDQVYGGTINISGMLEIEISTASTDTTLSRIKELILRAEESRTPIMRLIDQYAGWYTPVALMLAGIVLFFTRDINRAVSMLIIACPCTILLSSPTALVAALSAAARLGVIIKDVAILETANRVNALVFDKTGTLTTGSLYITALYPSSSSSEEELLRCAAAAEFSSKHPAAKAIVAEARQRNIGIFPATAFMESSGWGVQADIGGSAVFAGKMQWLEKNGIEVPAGEKENLEGQSVIYLAADGRFLGRIALSDRVRPDAEAMMAQLRKGGIEKIVMISGDRRNVAEKVASELGCEVEAEVLPEEKMNRVLAIKKQGLVVAVIGDGVNDAPALASGDISIAMGAAGSDVAIHSASIVLMNEKLDRIPFVITLSRRTVRIMKQNLIFSALYILILLAASAAGTIHPAAAVIMHTVSAFLVVFNSARLLREGENLS